jgi:hypothetical protein
VENPAAEFVLAMLSSNNLTPMATLLPHGNERRIVLQGDRAAILSFDAGEKKPTFFRRPTCRAI